MVLLEVPSEVPRVQHFLTMDVCADQANTHKNTLFIETGIHFRVIKPPFFNLIFPISNLYVTKRIISIYEK